MAQRQPSTNQPGPPTKHRFPFLRDLAHPHWSGINGIAAILGVLATIVAIVVTIILAQGSKSGSSNGQPGTNYMTATALAVSSATPSSFGSLGEFPIPTPNSLPIAMADGSDSNFWFTEATGNRIGRITPQGQITEFQVPLIGATPGWLFTGPNGNLWFTDDTNHIGQVTPSGTFLDEIVISGLASQPFALIVGKERIIWFTEPFANKIGRVVTGL